MKIKITAKKIGNVVVDGVVIKPGITFEVKEDSAKRVTQYLKYENIKFKEVKESELAPEEAPAEAEPEPEAPAEPEAEAPA